MLKVKSGSGFHYVNVLHIVRFKSVSGGGIKLVLSTGEDIGTTETNADDLAIRITEAIAALHGAGEKKAKTAK